MYLSQGIQAWLKIAIFYQNVISMRSKAFMGFMKKHFLVLFVVFAFVLRLWFGLCGEFWFEDERQIFLLGLKFFTTGHWPYFGPDVVYTHSQITGALQSLLAGLPFYLYKAAAAPYILLNLLSVAALSLLSWYCVKLTNAPKWVVWGWLFFCPWTMNFSTHVLNPSYVLFGSVLFFISFFEVVSCTRLNVIAERWAFFIMGFAFFWIYQLHLSWVLLVPILGLAFYSTKRPFQRLCTNLAFFILGSIPMLLLIIPTFIKFGLLGTGRTEQNIIFNSMNLLKFFDVLFRTLSFASFEVPRFIGPDTKVRLAFVMRNLWAVPFIGFGFVIGMIQPLSLLYGFFRKNILRGWNFIRYLLLALIFITYVSFLFSIKGPSSHAFYLLFPVVAVYSFYCWSRYLEKRVYKVFAFFIILSSLVFHVAIATDRYGTSSMFAIKDGETGELMAAKALETKDYKVLGERRCKTQNYNVCF